MTNEEAPPGLPLPLTGSTRVFAIVGDPIDQAGSPALFNQAFRRHGVNAVLVPLCVSSGALGDLLSLFRQSQNWDGLVITVPHKIAMSTLVDELGPAARLTGAVNAIRKQSDGRLLGENFDGEGFIRGLAEKGHALRGRRILIIGAGGAGRAISYAIAGENAAEITLVDQVSQRADQLAAAVKLENPTLQVRTVQLGEERAQDYDVIVNCAPPADHATHLNLSMASQQTLVVDIVLKPAWTPLLAEAKALGLSTHEGIHMLSGQLKALLDFFRLPH